MKVVIAVAAKRDLIAVADYIRAHNPACAMSFVEELLDHCQSLAELPRRFPLIPRYEHHEIRRRVHANYLIFYRVGADVVEIIHVLHGAQDYEPLLFPGA